MSHRVLYVEDDEVDQLAFKRMVAREHLAYAITLCGTLSLARELLKTEKFDVVIADYRLGDGTGLEVLEWQLQIPVIIVTGMGDEEIAVTAMRTGAVDYVIKDPERNYLKVLPMTVDRAVNTSQAVHQTRLLSYALKSIGDSLYIVDPSQHILFVNRAFCDTYGYQPEAVQGQDVKMLWANPADIETVRHAARTNGRQVTAQYIHRRANGEEFPVSLSASIMDTLGQAGERVDLEVMVVRDITEQVRSQEALRESQERYALAVQGANDGLWDWNLKTNDIYYSPRWRSMLGMDATRTTSSPWDWFNRVHPDDLESVQTAIQNHLSGLTSHFESEHRMLHQGGSYRWVLNRGLAVRDASGTPFRMAGSQSDVTERRFAEEQLRHHAFHDALTGLPNRSLFMNRLEQSLERRKRRPDYEFAVIFLDLDRFKIINDSLGHMVGDELLSGIAHRLKMALRPTDTVARLGGDEFAILVDGVEDPGDASVVADRLQKALTLPFRIGGQDVFTSASFGIALSVADYGKADDFLRDADTAMYRAKAHGRARQETFDSHMHDSVLTVLQVETDLWKALEREEFVVFYQPVVSLTTGRVLGAEALLRWRHPDRGLVSPADFIPLAEETHLIVPIGEWVMREACRQARTWHDAGWGDIRVMVNVSYRQFHPEPLCEMVRKALHDTGLAPHALSLELTEGTAMHSMETTLQTLKDLRSLGISLSIDDFGTGYSSLACLRLFPIKTLKLDQSFVRGITAQTQHAAITRAIIAMAHSLDMEVVAEGVEEKEELDFLLQEGCDAVQGYIFSRPIEAAAFSDLLARNVPLMDVPTRA